MENPKENAKPEGSEEKLEKPHDKLFKVLCKRPNLVREIIEAKAPKDLLAILNLDKLRLSDSSYVDEKLSEDFADVVLTAETKDEEPVELPFIWEHKSYVPAYPNRQIMRYQGNVWDFQIATKGLKPTPVIPFLFYHGEEKWVQKKWGEFLKGWQEELAPFTPMGWYILINLSSMADEEIKRFRSGFLRTALLLMKHRFEREYLLGNLPELVNFVETDSEEEDYDNKLRNWRIVLRYLDGLNSVKREEVLAILQKNDFAMQAMPLTDEEIKLEGKVEGIEIGIEKGIETGIEIGAEKEKFFSTRNMLHQKFAPQVIAGVLEVSADFVQIVAKQLVKETKIKTLLLENKLSIAAIAEKLKVSHLLVEAVRKEMDKAAHPQKNRDVALIINELSELLTTLNPDLIRKACL